MKFSHLLLALVSLTATVATTRAATLDRSTEIVRLPAFPVEVPRQTEAERELARSLAELGAAARTPLAVKVEVPMQNNRNDDARPAPLLVLAKS